MGRKLKLRITKNSKLSPKRYDLALFCTKRLANIVNSARFQELFLVADFSGETSKYKDWSNLNLYKHFMSGSETLSPDVDNEIDITIKSFYKRFGPIGYTYPSRPEIYVNERFFDNRLPVYSASNIIHECGHKMGFKHDYKRTKRRPKSICYQLNEIVEQIWFEFYPEDKPKPKKKKVNPIARFFRWLF